jgi:hypothetical protein
MTHVGVILALPRVYATLQFSYRLESYILLGCSGAVLALLALARGEDRALRLWSWLLLPVLLVSLVGALQQTAAYPRMSPDRYTALAGFYKPGTGGETLNDYFDSALPSIDPREALPAVTFAPTAVRDERIAEVVRAHPGELLITNLAGPPGLVHVDGARIAGIDGFDHDVLQVLPAARSVSGAARTQRISLSPAESWPVVLGRVLSLLGLALLTVQLAAIGLRRRRASTRS